MNAMDNMLSDDWIVLDTNVLLHSLHADMRARRIRSLLDFLVKNTITILVDGKKVILNEYYRHLTEQFKNKKEQDTSMRRVMRLLDPNRIKVVDLEKYPDLHRAVRRLIPKGADKVFVSVAFSKGRVMVTNDKPLLAKREKLLSSTAIFRNRIHKSDQNGKDGSDILSSDSAEARTRGQNKRRSK